MKRSAALFFGNILLSSSVGFASSEPNRGLQLKQVEREGQDHIKLRAFAFESDLEKKYPIKTLDKSSFQILLNGTILKTPNTSLTTFDTTRRWNNRATVWIYDATGVNTMKGLTRDLRALVAQEFPELNSDYISILGVAPGKSIERVLLDPANQENILVLRRNLIAEPTGLKPSAVHREPALCVAASRFTLWQNQGLRPFDQKNLILMGGASQLSAADKKKTDECVQNLIRQNVSIQQIVFAKPNTFNQRQWITTPDVIKNGSVYRVVDRAGASRAIQNIKSSSDHEYLLTVQLPPGSTASESEVSLQARYHEAIFTSNTLKIPNPLPREINQTPLKSPVLYIQPPQRLIPVVSQSALAFDAWMEWLITSFVIGVFVTFCHVQRMNTGITELPEKEVSDDVSQGPLLTVLNGKDKGRQFRIRQASTLLGKSWGCDIRLQPLGVKSKHGRLDIQGDKAVLQDLSGGDLYVNGRPIHTVRVIGHGSVLRFGDLQLLFQCGES